ncbi:hypothetical protein FNV43_RR10065 [Rhamnella rubrinervis]|uniref:ADP-ribosyl cyclase/cyclic ADP-ribose hydrolase n=1 Tax=Rhamnella rubrinervis TaxID=2594499 RepID=A0A8K0HB71_9ROSA|nr:hypothetical protein FNV43_RR10065 [Rhamnella rubrinervis]
MVNMASSSSRDKHDVFISFRGEDTRDGFTSFLYEELRRKAIKAYMDVREFETGDEISPALEKAIKESKISVIIFSKNYASSTWCLNELVQILKCKEINKQIVLPVFYQTDAFIVRDQTESYAVAFEKHEKRFKDDNEKVNQWRKALKDATYLHGLDSKEYRSGPMLVRKIVDDIWLQLRKKQTSNHHYKGLFGIEERINQVQRLLSIGSTDARIIGIYGMGGIGKTTLASAIYQKLNPLFEGHCFLENVREVSVGHSRYKLLTGLFNDRAIQSLDTPFVVSSFIGDRFRRKKVLIVLDDVDSSTNLEALIKGYEEVDSGSRIIVTSRDAHVLKNVTKHIYEVRELDVYESLDLFRLHAFKKERPGKDFKRQSERVVRYAYGNPLALKVLGCFLHARPIEEWKSALKKLEMVPHNEIQKVLRISYEGLDDMQKDMFLDIACFFAHPCSAMFSRNVVESIQGSSSAKIDISVLEEKSLITIDGVYQKISMHNLLQQMGLMMVCEEHKEPGNRSRLWRPKDISHVLETASGTDKIKSITLHLCELQKDVKVSPAAFSKMSNLHYFQIISHKNAKFRLLPDNGHGFEFHPFNKLRYFCWILYPYKSFPSGLIPENLVRLDLTNSQLVEFWNEDQPAPALEKLKFLDIHDSENLTQIPNLSRAISIEEICLARCRSLVQVPPYFKNLHKLQTLNLSDCSNLVHVEGLSKNLSRLCLGGTAIEAVPSSVGCLAGLVVLKLDDCRRLKILPTNICKLKSLQSLGLSGCLNLETFPEILEPIECLKHISLRGTMIKELPQLSIDNLIALSELDLGCCKNIEFLLSDLCCSRNIDKLVRLNVSYCENLESIPELPPCLKYLDVRFCENLKSIHKLPSSLTNLDARDCIALETISSWGRTPLIEEQSCFLDMSCSYRFDNCQRLDQNLTSNIIPHAASLEILCAARSPRKLETDCDHRLSILFCYPGDAIPNYFVSHIDPGTSINIELPSNWWDANFLGFAFCFVLNLSEISCEKSFDHIKIECAFSFMTDDGDVEYSYKVPVKWDFQCSTLNSDHVLILYDNDLSYKNLQENFGSNLSSISTFTKASFSFRLSLHYVDVSQYSHFKEIDSSQCRKMIKKCGVWLIYDQEDGGKLMDIDQNYQVSGGNTHEFPPTKSKLVAKL